MTRLRFAPRPPPAQNTQLTLRAPRPSRTQGDIILVGLRDYQDEKADVILK